MQLESQQCSGQTTAIYIKLKDKRIIGRLTFMKCYNIIMEKNMKEKLNNEKKFFKEKRA